MTADRLASILFAVLAGGCTAHGMRDELCAVVWLEQGRLKVLAPQGHDEAMALMLYRAADTFADRAPSAGKVGG